MSTAGYKLACHEWWTSENKSAIGEWLATILAWAGVMAMLLAVVAVLLGPAQ
jgi:hypothetical protein